AGSLRRTQIGPSPRPASQPGIAFTEVHEAKKPTAGAAAPADPKAPDSVAVSGCRRGELPPTGWSTKWTPATKHAALLAAIEESQMHVVYALRPQSDVWQESIQSVSLEQAELDRLMREKMSSKPRPTQKQRVKEAITWLLEAGADLEVLCADGNSEVRSGAAALLAELGPENGGSRAVALLQSSDAQARATAAEAIGRLGREAASHAEAVVALLGDPETTVRMAAVAAIGKLGPAAAKFCATALGSEKPLERMAACEALGHFGSAAVEHAAAVAELLEDSNWQVPTAAASALKRFGAGAAKHCAEMLGRCKTVSRHAVAEAIVRLGGAEAAESLVPLLASRDEGVRKYAADCLGQLGPEAKPFAQFLTPLKEDPDREVKRAAMQALIRLGLGPAPREELGNGDDLPPPPQHANKGKGKGKRDRGSK
ncbi:ANK1, partial [Symbiodinium sp. KB8]